MIFFGHLGIGNAIAAPLRRGLNRRWILLGTVLPDLIDKPLYYGLVLITGRRGAALGLISGTHTFGHTALLLFLLGLAALLRKSRILAALTLGMATHLVLDGVTGLHFSHQASEMYRADLQMGALLWPLTGPAFPLIPFRDLGEHVHSWFHPFLIGAEAIGAALLGWDFWKRRHRAEIVDSWVRFSARAASISRRSRADR